MDISGRPRLPNAARRGENVFTRITNANRPLKSVLKIKRLLLNETYVTTFLQSVYNFQKKKQQNIQLR